MKRELWENADLRALDRNYNFSLTFADDFEMIADLGLTSPDFRCKRGGGQFQPPRAWLASGFQGG